MSKSVGNVVDPDTVGLGSIEKKREGDAHRWQTGLSVVQHSEQTGCVCGSLYMEQRTREKAESALPSLPMSRKRLAVE